VSDIHGYIGFAVVGIFTIGWLWGLGAWIVRRGPGTAYWAIWLPIAQVVAGLQAVFGIVLLLFGRTVEAGGTLGGLLHYVYGLLPILLFVVAHVIARAGNAAMLGFSERRIAPWVPFAWASFISFGLTLRALMTGLGVG
jgi:hypothetical protein